MGMKDMKKNNRNYSKTNSNHNRSSKGKYQSGGNGNFVHAPYNFVPFSKQVVTQDKSELVPHNSLDEQLYTGEISYEITAKTPIFVDNGKGSFHQNMYGEYSIPGSTIRGLIRNNVQILGLSSFNDDIDDYSLMYRNVASGLSRKEYTNIFAPKLLNLSPTVKVSIPTKVKAGYISNENGKYVIYQTVNVNLGEEFGEVNYYPLSEKIIVQDYLDAKKKKRKYSYEFFDPKNNILQNKFAPFKNGNNNENYMPYFEKISYEVKDLNRITNVGKPGVYSKEGYVISSGYVNKKKILYIIPKVDHSREAIALSDDDVQLFMIDYNKRKNKLPNKDQNDFFNLPEKGKIKPVFYIQYLGKMFFGFTPHLRICYKHTVKEGLPKNHKKCVIDYSKSMFGYANDQEAYKSKVSFTDAIYSSSNETNFLPKCSVMLGEPEPTAVLQYVNQNGGNATYNKDGFQLRGVKQYWIHSEITHQEEVNQELYPPFQSIESGSVFSGKIRFNNLKKDELGLLLWSVILRPESWMNIGKAKSYGYGAIKLNVTDVKVFDPEAAYKSASLDLSPYHVIDVEELINYYKETVKKQIGNIDIEDLNSIKEFFVMKDSTNLPESRKTEYMTLNQYSSQKKPLPAASKVVQK